MQFWLCPDCGRHWPHDPPIAVTPGQGVGELRKDLKLRRQELEAAPRLPGERGPESPIEMRLLEALCGIPDLPPPVPQHEIRDRDRIVTIPDFAYPDARIAIFCDGFAFHGNPDTLELDARKRNWLQSKDGGEWTVLTYWGRTIVRNAEACAREIAEIYRQKRRRGEAARSGGPADRESNPVAGARGAARE